VLCGINGERMTDTKREESEEMVDILAQELYATSKRCFTPVYPWVFVRVLPKEQITAGGIVLPMHDQNKTVHEGIVLAIWKPVEHVATELNKDGVDWRSSQTRDYRRRPVQSDLKAGDHVLFQHWAGIPVEGFSEKRYRVVKDLDWRPDGEGGIFATVEYMEGAKRAVTRLHTILSEANSDDAEAGGIEDLVTRINSEFMLVERGGYSVTLSGR
jgi:co-chaperonin GroES (HSP10)